MSLEPSAQSNVQQAVPFFSVSNIEASLHYYVNGLGFEMTNKWIVDGKIRWCWLQKGRAALMLQEFAKEGRDSWVPEGKVGVGGKMGYDTLYPRPSEGPSSSRRRTRKLGGGLRQEGRKCVRSH